MEHVFAWVIACEHGTVIFFMSLKAPNLLPCLLGKPILSFGLLLFLCPLLFPLPPVLVRSS